MFPNILGFEDSSYILMMVVGIIAGAIIATIYLKNKKISKAGIIDLLICLCFAVSIGIVFAVLFENLYEVIANPNGYQFSFKMTFFGGLFGAVLGFLFVYLMLKRKHTDLPIKHILVVAPASISAGHFFGRIGCFLAGCCYGKETNSWIGMKFPSTVNKVIPTQLIEALFLLILSLILLYLVFKNNFKYSFVIYTVSYSIFRFIIEFYRGDERGAYLGPFSPSQVWCLIIFSCSIPLYIFLNKYLKD